MRPKLRLRASSALVGGVSLALGLAAGLAPSTAAAAVTGSQGVEIEGPRDRRGFFIGPGLNFGAQFFSNTLVPAMRLDLNFGGGVTKNFTLGANINLGVYLANRQDRQVFFGGDIEGTGFVYKGFFLRGGIGGAGVPRGDGTSDVALGVGGLAGLGYEFWLNQSAALNLGLHYDIRYIPGSGLRHGGYIGLRFLWY
ncbi:MAG: hypothetical protein H6711_34635 [Myxococcales bacterium]|nr:hypothetical protein [Myxococcales bacterium]